MKKNILIDDTNAFVVGINTSLSPHMLVFRLNKYIRSKFKKVVSDGGGFQTYNWNDVVNNIDWVLKKTRKKKLLLYKEQGGLFDEKAISVKYLEPHFKNIDFLLSTISKIELEEKKELINQLKTVPNLIIIEQVKINKLKTI